MTYVRRRHGWHAHGKSLSGTIDIMAGRLQRHARAPIDRTGSAQVAINRDTSKTCARSWKLPGPPSRTDQRQVSRTFRGKTRLPSTQHHQPFLYCFRRLLTNKRNHRGSCSNFATVHGAKFPNRPMISGFPYFPDGKPCCNCDCPGRHMTARIIGDRWSGSSGSFFH